MKNLYFYMALLLGVLVSCGGDDEGTPEEENTAPSVPVQVYPLNNTLCIYENVQFEWEASVDAEGDLITYKIEVSENDSFSPLTHSALTTSTSKTLFLSKGKSYFWRLKAVDSKGAESEFSTVSQFLTEGDGVSNHIPFAPTLIAPVLDSEIEGTSTILSWSASDVDNDPLLFDVYLDMNEQPVTKVSENQTETTFNATGLTAASTYYFKVVVKDDNGGVSIGQVWRFTTE